MSSSEFQGFVAWRYLLAKPMRVSSVLIGFFSLGLWVAASCALLHFEYPRSQVLYTIPPNPSLPLLITQCVGAGAAVVFMFFGLLYGCGAAAKGEGNHGLRDKHLSTAIRYVGFSALGAAVAYIGASAAKHIDLSTASLSGDIVGGFLDFVVTGAWGDKSIALKIGVAFLALLFAMSLKNWAKRALFKRKQKHWLAIFVQACSLVLFGLGLLALFEASEIGWLALAVFSMLVLSVFGFLPRSDGLQIRVLKWLFWVLLFVSFFVPAAQIVYEQLLQTTDELKWAGGFFGYKTPMEIGITFAIAAALAGLLLVLVPIRFTFSFFTTVSIGGVAIGSMALVMVLSVMAGFEDDMRSNILGSNAHAVIRKVNESTYRDYDRLMEQVRDVPGVTGVAPFLTSEVLVAANNTYSNVIVKGIDPNLVSEVSELKSDLKEGDEDALEKLLPITEDSDSDKEAGAEDKGANKKKAEANEEVSDPAPEDMVVPDDLGPIDFGADDGNEDSEKELDIGTDGINNWGHSLLSPRVAKMPGLIVGSELRNLLGLIKGQEVMIVSPLGIETPMGTMPRTKALRVAGEFYSGLYEYDIRYVYSELGVLQDFLDVGEDVEGLEIRFSNPEKIEIAMAQIRSMLPDDFEVLDWRQLNKSLFSALKLEKIMMFIVLLIIILVASFSIMGNLIMVVVEKAREIAILKTLGATDKHIYSIFVTQGLIIGIVGTLIGVALGLLGAWQLKTRGFPVDSDVYYIDKLPILIEPWNVVFILVAGVLISGIATIYPAIVAAKTLPLDGMRPK